MGSCRGLGKGFSFSIFTRGNGGMIGWGGYVISPGLCMVYDRMKGGDV